MKIKELILGLLCSTFSCMFIIGLIPNLQFVSMLIGVAIACSGLYYVVKHKPAWWFLGGFVAGCVIFTFAF